MDNWVTFPDLFEQSLTDQQPPAYSLPREFDPGNELALHDFISAQKATNLPETLHPLSLSQENLVPMPQDTVLATINDAKLTTAAMDPPPKRRKKKAPTLRDKDWEPYKDRIFELHDSREFSLQEIKEMIQEEFGFTAELRQYQARISQWGKDKNIKKPEMAAIVRKRQQRKLVEINKREQIFSVRGRNVEPQNIDRWMTRNGVSQTSLYAPSPTASTLSAVFCRTISERGSVASSPTYSTRSLDFSPGTISTTSSPTTSSPVVFMPDMGYPQNTGFNIQSHAHGYQPISTIPPVHQPLVSGVIPLDQPPRRYRQDEEEVIREALSASDSSFGAYYYQTLGLRLELAGILVAQGRYKDFKETTRRAMEDGEKCWDSLTIEFDAVQLLAEVLCSQESWHQSQKLQKLLFEWEKANLGDKYPSPMGLIGLSWRHAQKGNLRDAGHLWLQALEISKKMLRECYFATIKAVKSLVYTLSQQGLLNEAERRELQLLTKSLAVLENRQTGTAGCSLKSWLYI